VYRANSV